MCSIFFEFCLQRCFKFFASHELQEIEATATHLNQNSYYLSLPLNILTSARAHARLFRLKCVTLTDHYVWLFNIHLNDAYLIWIQIEHLLVKF